MARKARRTRETYVPRRGKAQAASRKKMGPITATGPSCGLFFPTVLNPELWDEMVEAVKPALGELRRMKSRPVAPFTPLTAKLTEDQIQKAVATALRKLPAILRSSRGQQLSPQQMDDLRRILPDFLRETFTAPKFDASMVAKTSNFAGWKASLVDNAFALTVGGVPGIILADVRGEGKLVLSDKRREGHEKSTVAQVAFVIDIIIEIIGIILSLIGISIPFSKEEEELEKIMEKLLLKPGFRDQLTKLAKALKDGDYTALLAFLEFLEGSLDIGELFAHLFAGLGFWDYALTIGKFLAWLAAQFATGGAALAAELAGLALNVAGLANKFANMDEIF